MNPPSTAANPELKPPYYAVIFSSLRDEKPDDGYATAADRMVELASEQDGFLGIASTRDPSGLGITVSYWRDLNAIQNWRRQEEHLVAQSRGRSHWYRSYSVEVCLVQRQYDRERPG
ncbi:MAG: antibiotic biosynthesis monooxygenase [Planctomycetota bacterium]